MSLIVYTLISYLLLPFFIIGILLKSRKAPLFRKRIYERLGIVDQQPEHTIWIHCVSVGEFRSSITLIDALIEKYSQYRVLVTCTTPTGSESIKKHYGDRVLHLYFPFDLAFIVRRYIKKVNPKLCILMETEIWPNLIQTLKLNHIPSILINARMSERSMNRYHKIAPKLVKDTLNNLTLIASQNENSSRRFIQLGAEQQKVVNAGNMKFDFSYSPGNTRSDDLMGIIAGRRVVTFASTHDGEEDQIINSFLNLGRDLDILLVIIPRHQERFSEVEDLILEANLSLALRSTATKETKAQVMLGDSMGEMMSYFTISDIVFMGGSLNNTGGHNMLEPASLSKPIIFGPNVFNFTEISSELLRANAAIQVQNSDELFSEIGKLLENRDVSLDLGKRAFGYFKSKQGAVKNIIHHIDAVLPKNIN